MTGFRALSTAILLAMGIQPQSTWVEWGLPQGGSYQITAHLELLHLERWAVDKTTIVCLLSSRRGDELPIPVVSANNPFEKCIAANLTADGPRLEYDIVCPGRGQPKAMPPTYFLPIHSLAA